MTRRRKTTKYTNTIPAFAPAPAPDFGAMLDEARGMFDTGRDWTLPAVSAGFGAVGVLGLSLYAPDALLQWYALSAIGPALLPPLAKGAMAAMWEMAEVIEWLRGKQQERDAAWQEEVDERHITAMELHKATLEAINERARLRMREKEYDLALDKGPIAAGVARKNGNESALLAQTQERRRWEPIVRFAYANQGRAVTGDIPWAKGKLGAARFGRLVELGAIAKLGNSRLYQWQYEVTGETEAEAMRWLEAHGFMSMEG